MGQKISIIVPCYNAEKTIKRCVKSIQNQSYSNIEIILVDDGSVDRTWDLCNELKQSDDRIHVIHQENGGPGKARNTGIRYATGQFVVFIDSDDTVSKEYCKELLDAKTDMMEELVICGYQEYYSGKAGNSFVYDDKVKMSVVDVKDTILIMQKRILNTPCGKLYNRDRLLDHSILFDENIILGEDLLFNLKYINDAMIQTIRIVNKPLYYYEQENETSITHEVRKNDFDATCFVRKKQAQYLELWQSNHMEMFWIICLNELLFYLEREWENNHKDKTVLEHMKDEFYGHVVEMVIPSKWQQRIYVGRSYGFLKWFKIVQEWKRGMCT